MKELQVIQTTLNAPKGQYNAFGKYKYRSCEDILAAVKPLLKANNCTLTISDDIVLVGDRFYIKAVATLTNAKGESVSTTAFAREEDTKKGMDASQVTGASSSYARKYALNGLLAIDDTKDADALNNSEQYTTQKAKSAQPSQSQQTAQQTTQAQPQSQPQQSAQRQWVMPSNYQEFMAKNHPEAVKPTPEQAPAQTADEIFAVYAMPAIQQAQNAADLKRVYDNYSGLQGMPEFLSALTARRKELGIKGKND